MNEWMVEDNRHSWAKIKSINCKVKRGLNEISGGLFELLSIYTGILTKIWEALIRISSSAADARTVLSTHQFTLYGDTT
jgi:hypothetical protein